MKLSTKRARAVQKALQAAGFTFEKYQTGSFEWMMRRRMHRYMSGQQLTDTNAMVQIGASEADSKTIPLEGFFTFLASHGPLNNLDVARKEIWICGPDAKWIARGNGAQLYEAKIDDL